MVKYLHCAVLLLLMGSARAEVTVVRADAGLPDRYITAICRDTRGLMWIGTRHGLCMFDSYHFVRAEGGLGNGANIKKLQYDAVRDFLWVASDSGLFAIRCAALEAVKIPLAREAAPSTLTDIVLQPDGLLYAGFKSGVLLAVAPDRSTTAVARFPQPHFPARLQRAGSRALLVQLQGRDQPVLLQPGSKTPERFAPAGKRIDAWFLKLDGDTLVTCGAGAGLRLRDRKTFRELAPGLDSYARRIRDITDVCFLSREELCVVSKPAVFHYIHLTERRVEPLFSEAFSSKLITCLYVDGDGIVWVGTNKGLIRITHTPKRFSRLLADSPVVSVRSIAEDELGQLYAGTYCGLYCSRDGRRWQSDTTILPYAVLSMPGKYVYFVTQDAYLYRLDKATFRYETGFYTRQALPLHELKRGYSLAADARGLLWAGTESGLVRYDPATNVLSGQTPPGLPAATRIVNVSLNRHGRLYLSTPACLYEYDPIQDRIVWQASKRQYPRLPADGLVYAQDDPRGNTWVCTTSGLAFISADRKRHMLLTTEDGLSDHETCHLLWQDAHRVWISTFNGLCSFTPATRTFSNYYVADGLSNDEFNHNAFLRGRGNRFYFGTISGITAFCPDSIPTTIRTSDLFVSVITKWDSKLGKYRNLPADTAAPVTLSPLDHSLTFYIALSDYHNPEGNTFRYRLRGSSDHWVTLLQQQAIHLDGLAAGTYTLDIAALNSRGTPARNTLHYRIVVLQPFFKSAWFYLLLAALSSGLLWAFFSLRIHHVKRVQRLRERISSDLHDEVGSLLTRITMTSENLQFARNTETDRSVKLEKIARLSRAAASAMRDILWAIDTRNDYPGSLADRIREQAEEMLTPLGIEIHCDFNINPRLRLSSYDRQQLYLLSKEAINNIAKHSAATTVWIRYHHANEGLSLALVNNGYRQRSGAVTMGQGLKNIAMRAERINAVASFALENDLFKVIVNSR